MRQRKVFQRVVPNRKSTNRERQLKPDLRTFLSSVLRRTRIRLRIIRVKKKQESSIHIDEAAIN